jgi:hypothetical protein
MASDNKKVYVAPQAKQAKQPEQAARAGTNRAVDPAYKVRKSRSTLPSKINPSEAMRGIVLAEVLGLPLSKRGRGRRWS